MYANEWEPFLNVAIEENQVLSIDDPFVVIPSITLTSVTAECYMLQRVRVWGLDVRTSLVSMGHRAEEEVVQVPINAALKRRRKIDSQKRE